MIDRRLVPAMLAGLLMLGLAACGEKKETTGEAADERVDLVLDYLPNADHAGIYAAIEEGEFKSAALDVKLRTPSDPSAPLKLLASGKADLAISYEPELLLARAQGAKLVSIGALVQRPLTSIISLGKRPIRRPAQLEGKKVGTAGIPYQDAYLKTILRDAGADPDSVKPINTGTITAASANGIGLDIVDGNTVTNSGLINAAGNMGIGAGFSGVEQHNW